MVLYDMSNLWLYCTCGFVSCPTDFFNSHWSPAKEKAFLNVVTQEWFSVPLPLYPSKMMVCKINPVLLRKERNKNVWGGNEHIWDERSWEQEEPLRWNCKILCRGRIERGRKAALPHCLPAPNEQSSYICFSINTNKLHSPSPMWYFYWLVLGGGEGLCAVPPEYGGIFPCHQGWALPQVCQLSHLAPL